MTVGILLVDGHAVIRAGLSDLLNDSEIQVVGESDSAKDALTLARDKQPRLVVLDTHLPDGDGLAVLEELQELMPDTRVVMLSDSKNPTYVARAVALGAVDYLTKDVNKEQLAHAVHAALASEPLPTGPLYREVANLMRLRERIETEHDTLTGRESQVLRHLALGLSNKEIARALGISVETVKEHVQNILRKCGAKDRTQVAVWAVRKGIA